MLRNLARRLGLIDLAPGTGAHGDAASSGNGNRYDRNCGNNHAQRRRDQFAVAAPASNHWPSSARSSSVICVTLPSGMTFCCTAC